jgi:hypothetical protein
MVGQAGCCLPRCVGEAENYSGHAMLKPASLAVSFLLELVVAEVREVE